MRSRAAELNEVHRAFERLGEDYRQAALQGLTTASPTCISS